MYFLVALSNILCVESHITGALLMKLEDKDDGSCWKNNFYVICA
jgi:hypothetical protein